MGLWLTLFVASFSYFMFMGIPKIIISIIALNDGEIDVIKLFTSKLSFMIAWISLIMYFFA